MESSTNIYIGIVVVLMFVAIYYFFFRTSNAVATTTTAINLASPPPGYYVDPLIKTTKPGDQWPVNWCTSTNSVFNMPYFMINAACPGTVPGLVNGGGGKCTTRTASQWFSPCIYPISSGPTAFTAPLAGTVWYS